MASLFVWMNGQRVGEWGTLRGGRTSFFRYDEAWAASSNARALSLSLPLTADLELRGPHVDYYFDNLLPDSTQIRSRLRARFKTASIEAFDLLAAIGRDCVGAVQLLPPEEEPVGWNRVDARPLSEREVETILRDVAVAKPMGHDGQEDLRISLAGAQEKTALLRMAGSWFQPHRATPTTHILKLPLGIVGNFRGDFSDSIENEWLCGQFLQEMELPVASSTIARFGEQRALVVTRFDRRWIGLPGKTDVVERKDFKPGKGVWIARVPQEDFCQATGRPQTQKYQADGGPTIAEALELLANSGGAHIARTNFVLAQLAFWLLAAVDGHGKNFSIFHRPGGVYEMTPLYDVLSAWPIIGRGKKQLPIEKAKLAMALPGRKPHYRIKEITARHWQELAGRAGIPGLWERMRTFVDSAESGLERLESHLPRRFPERVFASIRSGVLAQVERFRLGIQEK